MSGPAAVALEPPVAGGLLGREQIEGQRPTRALPWRQLATISVYWFGMQAIWGGYEIFGQEQTKLLFGAEGKGLATGLIETMGAMVALLVQPTMGTISDYTATRWGRRKAYILVGSVFDLIFLAGFALIALPSQGKDWDGAAMGTVGTIGVYVALYLLLQLSSNVAQGPFQGYVPDLVPEAQVGRASALIGVMRPAGLIAGGLIMTVFGIALNLWGVGLVLVGAIEVTLAIVTFTTVNEGPPARARNGRPWRSIAAEAWGTDVLRERSFLFMTAVRFLFLMGTGIFFNVQLWYLEDSLGFTETGRFPWVIAGNVVGVTGALLAAVPAARISDHTGRKPVIRGAVALAGTGIAIIAVAPTPWVTMAGVFLLGMGSGAYLAVDWALMTETIPLATSGRYMGLANVANAIATPIGLIVAGITIDAYTRSGQIDLGPRVGVALGILFLAGSATLLTWVRPRRDPRAPAATAA
jgi:MFS family permease